MPISNVISEVALTWICQLKCNLGNVGCDRMLFSRAGYVNYLKGYHNKQNQTYYTYLPHRPINSIVLFIKRFADHHLD